MRHKYQIAKIAITRDYAAEWITAVKKRFLGSSFPEFNPKKHPVL
ncbi:MAG: hypothetical protein NTY36_14270 [Deltaproteobacteria bacterium]|jgi:hypothetical protein|nr:hypothetical protein [Deltaproteobacteria bacterium]